MRIALAIGMSLLGMGTAYAADVLEPAAAAPSFSWSGVYVGVQGGFSWVDTSITLPGTAGIESSPSPNAFTLGGQAGYRYQFDNNVVLGVEGDLYSYFNKEDGAPFNIPPGGESVTVNYGGSLRGQAGYAFDRFLPYVTGGVAFINYDGGASTTFPGPIVPGGGYSGTKAGWTVGAGLAYAFTDHFIANVDYRYTDFGSTNFDTPGAGNGSTDVELKENALKIGFSYKF
ncbi:outer membrane protein [Mesorhizobium shangrilense]|uniref:Outer membrane protein n=1 Tax=Mesorhizobium shangrilense TaxID=460060 RepID=A0ABV2D7R8_9HYPH